MFEYFAWLYVWIQWVVWGPSRSKKGPGIRVTGGYKLPSRCWELNPDPLQEKSMFLTSESLFAFFQSIIIYWVLCVPWCTCRGQESLREVSCLFLPGGSWGPNFMLPAPPAGTSSFCAGTTPSSECICRFILLRHAVQCLQLDFHTFLLLQQIHHMNLSGNVSNLSTLFFSDYSSTISNSFNKTLLLNFCLIVLS